MRSTRSLKEKKGGESVKVIGHRGAAGLEPENTLRSFKKALALGVDELEMDVRQTKDGHLVLIHDSKVNRTTNGRGHVKKLTLAELKKLKISGRERIPTLEEVFELVRNNKVILNLDVKKSGFEEELAALIKKYGYEDRTFVISRKRWVLRRVKALAPRIRMGLIKERAVIFVANRFLASPRWAKKWRIDRISFKYPLATPKLVAKIHNLGMEVTVWTVNNLRDIQKMARVGVDAICSDYPDRVLEYRKSKAR